MRTSMWCGQLATLALVSGCYVETPKDTAGDVKRQAHASDDHSTSLRDPGSCRYGLGRGCLDGFIESKGKFQVEGKAFFNADELASRFSELINVQSGGKTLDAGRTGYQLTLSTALDNASFLTGFTYELIGESGGQVARAGDLRSDGNMSVDDLPPGTYRLTVMRSVKFQVTGPAAQTPTPPPAPAGNGTAPARPADTQADNKPVSKNYCATIYSEQSVDIREGVRTWQPITDYRLHVTANECSSAGNERTIQL